MFLFSGETMAQVVDTLQNNADTTKVVVSGADSLSISKRDTIIPFDNIKLASGSLEDVVKYSARDSMWFDAKNKQVHLYGNARINYTTIELNAGYILLDYQNNLVLGKGIADSTGTIVEPPKFKDKDQSFSAKELKYNFKTKKGIIYEAYTQQEELYVLGKKAKFITGVQDADSTGIKKDNVIYNEDALITTCDAPHPHFGIHTKKLKVIPDKLVVTGFSNLEIGGVPTPLILPFGFYPITKNKKHGVIIPNDFDFSSQWGLGLKDFGYYIPLSERADITMKFDYYFQGTYKVGTLFRYMKKYKYEGNFDFNFNNRVGEDANANKLKYKSFGLNWSHNQNAKAHPTRKFGGSVNIQTNGNQQRNLNDFRSVYTNSLSSNVNYSQTFPGKPYSYTAGFQHSQNTQTREMTMKLPTFNFQMQRIYPLKRKNPVGGEKWYERITLTYNSRFDNTFIGTDTSFFTKETLNNARFGVQHKASSDVQLKLFKYINIAPNINYEENWYWKTIDKFLDTTVVYAYDTIVSEGETIFRVNDAKTKWGTVITNQINGFKPFRTFNAGVSANTSLYFTKLMKKGWLRGVRHVITPTVSMGFGPDFTQQRYNYFRMYDTDVRPEFNRPQSYSIFDQGIFSKPSNSSQALILSYSLRNVLEMKHRSKKDSTDKKVTLFNNLTFVGNYNLSADTLKWSTITTNGNFRLFKGLTNINWNVTFDPYITDKIGNRINKFAIKETGKLVRMSNLRFAFSTGFTFSQIRDMFNGDPITPTSTLPPDDFLSAFNAFRINHYFDLNRNLLPDGRDTFQVGQHNIGINGNIPLSSKWTFNVSNISYDFKSKSLVYPDLGLTRDLHCWEMAFRWQPTRGTYEFFINVKQGPLGFLKMPYRKNNADATFGY